MHAQYTNEPVTAADLRANEIAVRAQCFAQRGDMKVDVFFYDDDSRHTRPEQALLW